jgi:hypothetical protein
LDIRSTLVSVLRVTACAWTIGLLVPGASAPAQERPSVSFSRDVVPILNLHCTSCHSPRNDWWKSLAGELDLSSYGGLMKGGEHGAVIAPGRPAASMLLARITQRDEGTRMPFLGKPLSAEDVQTIRQWVTDGAKNDDGKTPGYSIEVPNVRGRARSTIFVRCRTLTQAYLELDAIDPSTNRVMAHKQAAVKWEKDWADATAPGGWASWLLTWEESWPAEMTVRLTVMHTPEEPVGTMFVIESDVPKAANLQAVDFVPDPIELGRDMWGLFKFWLDRDSDLDLTIWSAPKREVFHDRQPDLPPGQRYYRWPLRTSAQQPIVPGSYTACLRLTPRSGGGNYAIAAYFSVRGAPR